MSNPFEIYDQHDGSPATIGPRSGQEIGDFSPGSFQQMNPERSPQQRFSLRWLFVSIAIIFVVLTGRVFALQVVSSDYYQQQAEGNRIKNEITKAPRGAIYDSAGELLVKNVPDFSVLLTGRELPRRSREPEAHAQQMQYIQETIGVEPAYLEEQYALSIQTGQPISIREGIEYTEALQLIIAAEEMPGIEVQAQYSREYLMGESMAHILGYTSKITKEEYEEVISGEGDYLLSDTIGKSGLEKSYEMTLRGEDGVSQLEVNHRGEEQAILAHDDPIAGESLHLTIDASLQQRIYERLKQEVDEKDLPGATAVILDPRNGAVRAMVSYPSYNNNDFVGGIDQEKYNSLLQDERNPLFHRAISGEYPSGSTFKPVVAVAALEEGVVSASDTVQSTGGLQIDRFYFPDWKAGGHGITNVTKAIAESVNTFFYLIGGGDNETTIGLGVDRIVEYGKRFGIAAITGIDIPGEADGFLPSKAWKEEFKNERWYIGDTYHLAIGQGDILVTPLQVAVFTSIIANGGTYYEPHVVGHITDQYNTVTQEESAVVKNEQVASPYSIQIARQGMRDAVTAGSAQMLKNLPMSVAGKTGTAQFGVEDKTHSWFTGFAPYENPELAITVIVEEGGGSTDAAVPIARDILEMTVSEPVDRSS